MVACTLASSRLLDVTRNWFVLILAIGTLLASTLIVVAQGPEVQASVELQSQGLMNASFTPLSKAALSALEIRFVPPRNSS